MRSVTVQIRYDGSDEEFGFSVEGMATPIKSVELTPERMAEMADLAYEMAKYEFAKKAQDGI